jgi:DNA-binding LacI/PurR family transcriptional regulator
MRKKVTLRDVAKSGGVSIGTVSRVFNGVENVDMELAEKVRRIATDLNYQPVTRARSKETPAKEKDTYFVIIIADKFKASEIWPQQVSFSIVRCLSQYGYKSLIEFHSEQSSEVPGSVKKSSGCIVWGSFPEAFYANLARSANNIPLVSYSKEISYGNSSCVIVDDKCAMRQATEYLLASKHRKIGLVTWSTKKGVSNQRYQGFVETMDEFGQKVNPAWVMVKDKMEKEYVSDALVGYELTKLLLSGKETPTAIIYASDTLAKGGMEAIKKAGKRIPDDISIIGFDDLVGSSETFPPLSTMKLDTMDIGRAITETLEKFITNRPVDKVVPLRRELIKRQTVAITGK